MFRSLGDPSASPFRALPCLPLVLGGALLVAPRATAATCVKIYYGYPDSPGSDIGSNTSLNAEYVILKNVSTTSRSITGRMPRDRTGYTDTFPSLSSPP